MTCVKGIMRQCGGFDGRERVCFFKKQKIRIKNLDFRDYAQMDYHFCCLRADTSEGEKMKLA